MKLPENDASEDDPRVLQSAREFLAEMEAGRQPDRHTFYARNPDLKPLLEECFDGIELAHGAGLALRPGPTPAHAEIPSAPLGDFKIVREIGRGGMGIVYEAVQLSLGRRVALKVLPFAAALDAKHLQRFKTEAHAAAQLHHTNIVPVYAVGCERGMHFYAMQLIDGRPLDRVIREMKVELEPDDTGPTINARDGSTRSQTSVQRTNRSRKSFRTAALLAAQVAEALEYAHEAGVVHRDVKPANLIIDARGTVWVTDFGLAQVTADVGLTQTGDVFGTLRYMSPEQASGRRAQVDHRTDVYSLGATLYEFLALEPLFPGQDRQTLLNQILNEEPRSPRHIDRSIPVELETIVLKALAKSPEERYATAGEMAADLRRFLDERPILARRPSLVDRTRKWVRRHPSTMGATLVLLILIVVGLAAATALIAREQGRTQEALDGERQRAEEAEQRFRLARGAADDMITMAEVELADQPHLHNLRRRLLETALAYYQQFIELRRYDSSAQMELAATRDKVKLILDDLAIMDGQGQLFLLDVPAVLDDLKLSDEQRLRLVELTRRLVALRQELFKDFYLLSSEERKHRYLELARTNDAGVSEILSKDHKKRLGQIDLQMKGISAFQNPNVLRELKLSSEQREQIHMVEAEFNHHGGPPGGPGGPKDPDPKERPDRKDPGFRGQDWRTKAAFAKIEKILQSEQWAKWQEMIGEPVAGGIRVGPGGPFGGPPGPR